MIDVSRAITLIDAAAEQIARASTKLSELDATTGDGDHGVNMADGFSVAQDRIVGASTPGEVFSRTASSFFDQVGGAAGLLFGSFFGELASELGTDSEPTIEQFVSGMERGVEVVKALGGARPGDKTMLDALMPAVEVSRRAADSGSDLTDVFRSAAEAARSGAEATAAMQARAGRARFSSDGAIGTADPGAHTVALLFEAWSASTGASA